MLQRFKNSPAVFQRGMQNVLKDLIGISCYVYIDDISIFGRDINEHNSNL